MKYSNDDEKSVDDKSNQTEEEHYKVFKTYRELSEKPGGEMPKTFIPERHNFFLHFHNYLRDAAKKVLQTEYKSDEEKMNDLFKALRLTPLIKKVPAENTAEKMVLIDLKCRFDVLFINLESNIHTDVIEYFEDMLF